MPEDILHYEGKTYTNDPVDRGGPTKFGITQSALAHYRGKPVTPDDVKNLTEEEARTIYQLRYIDAPGFSNPAIHPSLQQQLIDFGVNSGPQLRIMKLQKALGLTEDGILGPNTLTAITASDQHWLNNQLVKARVEMIANLVAKQPAQIKFLKGWLRRRLDFII
jgi:lysozyme family protein